MRIGDNPQRHSHINFGDYYHQIIIPVYIPNLQGYYKDAFEIFKINIKSILKTIHNKTYISVVANGCCNVVEEYILDLQKSNAIQEAIITQPIGKINAILKALVGNSFKFVTITDADVLFLNNWQKATYDVFECFPKTGFVCTTPTPKTFKTLTANIWMFNFFKNNIKYIDIPDVEAVKSFAKSIDNDNIFKGVYLDKFIVITSNKGQAVLGGGHFTGTYRGDVFKSLANTSSNHVLGGNSVGKFLDKPVFNNNLWRLSTFYNYTFHLGNVKESWMYEKLDSIHEQNQNIDIDLNFKLIPIKKSNYLVNKISNLFSSTKILKLYFMLHNKKNFYKL